MWSTFYFYFQLRADASYSRAVEARELKRLLAGLKELRSTGDDSYGAADGVPWLSMTLLRTSSGGWASSGACPELVNVIELIGSKREDGSKRIYVDLMIEIGALLQWEVIEEEDDDGNEDIVLWSPR